ELAWALVENSIDEIGFVVSQAHSVDEAIANPELIVALESLMGEDSISSEPEAVPTEGDNSELIRSTLTEELEGSFTAIEELDLDLEPELLETLLSSFADECVFMGETLSLPWLGEAVAPINEALSSDALEALLLTKEIILQLRIEIAEYLENLDSSAAEFLPQAANQSLVINALKEDLAELCQAIADLAMDTPESVIQQAVVGFADECVFMSETLSIPWLGEAVAPIEALLSDCEPFEVLLTVQQLALEIIQQRDAYLEELTAEEADDEVFFSSEEGLGTTEEVESSGAFFDFGEDEEDATLSTVMFAPPALSPKKVVKPVAETHKPAVNSQVRISLEKLEGMTNHVEELILSQSRITRQHRALNQANRRLRLLTRQFEPIREQIQSLYNQLAVTSAQSPDPNNDYESDFDSLEMDRYTDLHSSLQSFQELMLQIQETRTDIDFIDRELSEDLESSSKNLDTLYSKVTDSRLVPFDTL
ncbi:MAG: hybrid sensor histidine kinase/response regulator, partial [Cyanobacteria bacterium J06623_1]